MVGLRVLRWIAVACACVLSAQGSARAQSSAAAAEALFRAGRAASKRGDAAVACEKFRASYRLDPALGTLLNIAICEEALGQLASAWQHYQEVAQGLDSQDERASVARAHLQALEPRLPRLTLVRGADMPADASVWIDELDLGTASFDVPLPVDPGAHVVSVRSARRLDARLDVTLSEGQRRVLEVNAGSAPPTVRDTADSAREGPAAAAPPMITSPAAPAAPPPREREHASPVLAATLIGVGGVSLVASAVTTVLWVDRAAVVEEHCDSDKDCDSIGLTAARRGQTYFVTSLITLGVAAVSGGVGLAIWPHESSTERAVHVTPAWANGGPRLDVSARF